LAGHVSSGVSGVHSALRLEEQSLYFLHGFGAVFHPSRHNEVVVVVDAGQPVGCHIIVGVSAGFDTVAS
jgi:hypothetical protein